MQSTAGLHPISKNYGEGFDLAQQWLCQHNNVAAPNWRSMLRLKGIWAGKIQSPDPWPSASLIQPFCRWLLLRGLQRDGVLDRYDRCVISRSDFVWLCPHPPILDHNALWVPNGQHWSGLNDRHLVVSWADVLNCLNVIEDVLLESRRPGRRGRLMRFYKEVMQKTLRRSVASNSGKRSYDQLSRRRDM
jgi:hypothetical protein